MVLLDGTLIRTRRRTGAANQRNYSCKHKAHGLLFLALTYEKGRRLVWISAARPGRSSEITTARHNKLIEHLRVACLGALGDLGFIGRDDDPDNPVLITGYKAARTKPLTSAKNEVNKLIAWERAVCERASSHRKSWRILTSSASTPATPPRCCGRCSYSRTTKSPADRRFSIDTRPRPARVPNHPPIPASRPATSRLTIFNNEIPMPVQRAWSRVGRAPVGCGPVTDRQRPSAAPPFTCTICAVMYAASDDAK
ncbi:transposase family protein [Streptomyces sp. NBC_00056]|uniref:transposase family protein n=1 Tax=Streptomyces sp. NBC_00056 TaxID=2975633 RepID=UPI00325521C0